MTKATLQTRFGYTALMMFGLGVMLLALAGGRTDKDRVANIAGVGFVVLGIVFLVIAGGWEFYRKLFRVREPEAAENETPQSSINMEISELTETERALIRLLRTNDVPPDVVAEAIREVIERRMERS